MRLLSSQFDNWSGTLQWRIKRRLCCEALLAKSGFYDFNFYHSDNIRIHASKFSHIISLGLPKEPIGRRKKQ